MSRWSFDCVFCWQQFGTHVGLQEHEARCEGNPMAAFAPLRPEPTECPRCGGPLLRQFRARVCINGSHGTVWEEGDREPLDDIFGVPTPGHRRRGPSRLDVGAM